jgi:flagellar biogenesis protein FliO
MLLSIGSSLAIVVGLFLGVAWCYRKTLSTSMSGSLPKQVVDILGRSSLSARQQMILVRFGQKLVLVSVIQGEARTLSEITDPVQVDQLVGLCESSQPGSITNSFKSVLLQEGSRR